MRVDMLISREGSDVQVLIVRPDIHARVQLSLQWSHKNARSLECAQMDDGPNLECQISSAGSNARRDMAAHLAR